MKFSLAWLCDHLSGITRSDLLTRGVVERLTASVAEIASARQVSVSVDSLFLVSIKGRNEQGLVGTVLETGESITLVHSSLVPVIKPDTYLLVVKIEHGWRLATTLDLGGSIELEIGYITLTAQQVQNSAWKSEVEAEDTIFTIDNVALTHRPDLWGHRGLAREIAVLFDAQLVSSQQLCVQTKEVSAEHSIAAASDMPFSLKIVHPELCSRLGAFYLPQFTNMASPLHVVARLARIDARSISGLVDLANYVMYDWGHPLHTFDAEKISKELIVTNGSNGQQLALLDNSSVVLDDADIVICDAQGPLSLAGIMGGASSRVTESTRAVIVEAGCFANAAIRATSGRVKKRSEASARFEKGLDGEQVGFVLARFARLAADYGLSPNESIVLHLVGVKQPASVIEVEHAFLEQRLGIQLEPEHVLKLLSGLGCLVQLENKNCYSIHIPSHRLRDLKRPEDIVEEVGRLQGYDAIPLQLPPLARPAWPLGSFLFYRSLRHACAFIGRARELRTYAFYDEAFLQKIQYCPPRGYELKNPVSETAYKLVDSLVPHLIKAVWNAYDTTREQQIRFFEMARTWKPKDGAVHEQSSIALLWYTRESSEKQFFIFKDILTNLFASLHVYPAWHPLQEGLESAPEWYHPFQTAALCYKQDLVLGKAGMLHPRYLPEGRGAAFCAELDIACLYAASDRSPLMQPLPKYQESSIDISVLVPYELTADALRRLFAAVDPLIVRTELIDFFQQPEWIDRRSVTIRLVLRSDQRTLMHDEIVRVEKAVHEICAQHSLQVR